MFLKKPEEMEGASYANIRMKSIPSSRNTASQGFGGSHVLGMFKGHEGQQGSCRRGTGWGQG